MDNDTATMLMDVIERLYIENLARKTILSAYCSRLLPPQFQIDQLVEDAKKSPELLAIVGGQFAQARARILEDANLEEVLREYLRVAAPKKDVN
jgi:hypothetical protein